ncbi:hypothetical protein MRX96_008257 [Rhipicephalus microplus]
MREARSGKCGNSACGCQGTLYPDVARVGDRWQRSVSVARVPAVSRLRPRNGPPCQEAITGVRANSTRFVTVTKSFPVRADSGIHGSVEADGAKYNSNTWAPAFPAQPNFEDVLLGLFESLFYIGVRSCISIYDDPW